MFIYNFGDYSYYLIDIIITCFNADEFIENSIGSVLNQENTCINKIIIIDDASSDDTAISCKAIIHSNVNYNFELVINEKNMGPSYL